MNKKSNMNDITWEPAKGPIKPDMCIIGNDDGPMVRIDFIDIEYGFKLPKLTSDSDYKRNSEESQPVES